MQRSRYRRMNSVCSSPGISGWMRDHPLAVSSYTTLQVKRSPESIQRRTSSRVTGSPERSALRASAYAAMTSPAEAHHPERDRHDHEQLDGVEHAVRDDAGNDVLRAIERQADDE